MDIFILLIVCAIISISINGSIGIASAFDSYTPIIKRVSLTKFERFATTNINSENHENDVNIHQYNKQSNKFTSRRSFVSSSIFIASTLLYPNFNANADELNNLHYKSKADGDEDPLVVFGKSLENIGTDSTNNSSGSGSSAKDTSSLSFSDISFPQSTDDTTSPPPDLNKALKERKDSQKRSVDPRTHG